MILIPALFVFVQLLLTLHAQPPQRPPTTFCTSLTPVTFEILQHVIEQGQPNNVAGCFKFTFAWQAVNNAQQTLLHIAVLSPNINLKVVQLVFDACGQDCLHAKDVYGGTPLEASLRNWNNNFWEPRENKPNPYIAATALLLQLGADPNTQDRMGRTPLMTASRKQNYKCVNLLLQNGADPAAVDFQLSSALHYSVEWFIDTVVMSKRLVAKSIDSVGLAKLSNAMDEIHTDCTAKLQQAVSDSDSSDISSALYLGIQDGIQQQQIASALVDCSYFDRTSSILIKALERSGKKDVLHTVNGLQRTVLEMAHPRMRPRLLEMATSTVSSIETSVLGENDDAGAVIETDIETETEKEMLTVNDVNTWSSERCDFDVRSASTLSAATFQSEYFKRSRPVLVLNATDHSWNTFRSTLSNETWLHELHKRRPRYVEVGTIPFAKSFNVDSMSMSIGDFLTRILPASAMDDVGDKVTNNDNINSKKKSNENKSGNKKKNKEIRPPPPYLFHVVDMTNAKSLKQASPLEQNIVNSLGNFSNIFTSLDLFQTAQWYFGSQNSGAPMHFHGNALNVLLRGTKLWAMLPPKSATYSRQHPSTFMSTFEASRATRGKLKKNSEAVWCEQPSGSFLFVPAAWSHAVLNLDKVVAGVAIEIIHAGTKEASREWQKLSEDGYEAWIYAQELGHYITDLDLDLDVDLDVDRPITKKKKKVPRVTTTHFILNVMGTNYLKYEEILVENGYETILELREIDLEELLQMGMKIGHAKRFVRYVRSYLL
jgi:ankyrin repeat protein